MGFTIEDMMLISRDKYQMQMVAGQKGWSNSISFILMLEDRTIIRRFDGKELAVTTGLGFQNEGALLDLAKDLTEHHASGLVINIGEYVSRIPASLLSYCNENDLPLLTVPWDVHLADMIKDLSIRIFVQGSADEQISGALIHAIEHPDEMDRARTNLLPYFDTDGIFQVFLIHTKGLDSMDTVDRRRIAYRLQLYFANITHNGNFFYYDGSFVMVMNDIPEESSRTLILDFAGRIRSRFRDLDFFVGGGSPLKDISRIALAYSRAAAAEAMAEDLGKQVVFYDDMGVWRLLYSTGDRNLLKEMEAEALQPLLDYDAKHDARYVETLEQYLAHDGSIQEVAKVMFAHRNTVLYRINHIKRLLNCSMSTEEERLPYVLALMIRKMKH